MKAMRADSAPPAVPETGVDMVLQCQAAVERAFSAGLTRQTVRFALVPPEEPVGGVEPQIWTGGPEAKLVRAAAVSMRDVYDFDGSCVAGARPRDGDDANGAVFAGVFFNALDAAYLDELERLDAEAGPGRLVLLVNPAWKGVDSWTFDLLQPR
jgi:hypothetical protein